MKRIVLGAAGLLTLLTSARVGTRAFLEAKADAKRLSPAHFELLLAEVKALQADPPLGTCGAHDAGEVLNALLPLDDGKEPVTGRPWWAEPAVHAALTAGGTRWLDHIEDGPPGDLSITETLLRYDDWSSTSSGPGAALLAAGDPGLPSFEYPIPLLAPLADLAKLRLLDGLRTGDPLPALREVRHLATLLSCDDWLIGQHVAIGLLGIEADGYDEAVKRGQIAPDAWSPVSAETRQRMKRVVTAMTGVYAGSGPEGSLARLEASPGPVFGRCAALGEAAMRWMILRPYSSDPWPLESDHSGPIRALDAVLDRSPCRLSVARQLWSHPEWDADTPIEGIDRWLRLPYVRDVGFSAIMAVSAPFDDPYP